MSSHDHMHWLADVTAADVDAVGISGGSDHGPASVALVEWAREHDVDLGQVHDCLMFLRSGPHVLLAPSPLALMSYSPRRRAYRASFDLAFPEDMASATVARAGAWLAVLASEVGDLPTAAGHWLVASLGPRGLEGANASVVGRLKAYSDAVLTEGVCAESGHAALSEYERSMCSAVWRCIAYAAR